MNDNVYIYIVLVVQLTVAMCNTTQNVHTTRGTVNFEWRIRSV